MSYPGSMADPEDLTPEQLKQAAWDRMFNQDDYPVTILRESDAQLRIKALGANAPVEVVTSGDAAKEIVQ